MGQTAENDNHTPPTIEIRRMTLHDLPACNRLSAQAGWNQTEADWLRALTLGPGGCFVAEINGITTGSLTTCCFGSIAWIAMVLVDISARGKGVAASLMEHALKYLKTQQITSVRLDATALGRPVYEKLGFRASYELIRFHGRSDAPVSPSEEIASLPAEAVESMIRLDETITGTPRGHFLRFLYEDNPASFFFTGSMENISGFATARVGKNAVQIGPVCAVHPKDGINLLDRVTANFAGNNIYIDIPVRNATAISWAHRQNLTEERRFLRMIKGDSVLDNPAAIWAGSGPEKG